MGCSFGGKVYALDETWHPDLGEPFGVMRCVLCACEAPQWGRRARGAGRVSCKNIKPECPTLACGQPRQLPGHCCQTCPQERSGLEKQPTGLAFEYPRDPEHRSYSDRGEPGAEDRGRGDGHTDFVALLTGPRSQAVARARVSLLRSSLRFSISYRRLDRPTRIRFSDSTGSILFEHPAAPTQDGLVCGVWRAVPRLSLRLLRAEQLHVALVTPSHPSGEVWGPLIRHRALAAETFSAILTLEGPPQQGIGGIALLTLSDTEDSLHFLLLFRGLLEARSGGPAQVPLRLQILHQGKLLRELQANASAQEPGFAEVLPNLTAQEMDWLVLGELQMALERAIGPGLRISGHIAARQSCDGCYFDGDRSWRAAGTRWHPVVPPFGLIKCAVCTCKGGTGEVHCEKVQCPRLACAQPVRANPTDCCKQCPVGSGAHPQLGDPMQADGPRGCRFAGQWFPESQSWHPSVPPFGEMSCITCRCGAGVPHCERDDCSLPLSCGPGKESRCCSHCTPRRRSVADTRTVPELEKEAEGS
ncbi:Chordin, partial [Eschrichtius robustus]|nr:Chordin [Eschrichtius robustus]